MSMKHYYSIKPGAYQKINAEQNMSMLSEAAKRREKKIDSRKTLLVWAPKSVEYLVRIISSIVRLNTVLMAPTASVANCELSLYTAAFRRENLNSMRTRVKPAPRMIGISTNKLMSPSFQLKTRATIVDPRSVKRPENAIAISTPSNCRRREGSASFR
jgi:hypothetical protein